MKAIVVTESVGNGRDEAGGAARAAGSDKRCRRPDSCVGVAAGLPMGPFGPSTGCRF